MEITIALLAALAVGLVQVVKTLGTPSKFVPLCALGVGLALSFLAMPILNYGIATAVINGIVIGLTSVGLFSGVKNTIEK